MITKVNEGLTPLNNWSEFLISYYILENGKYQLITERFNNDNTAFKRIQELKKQEI